MNTGAPGTVDDRIRVLKIQAKLHRWSGEDAARRFDDLFNLVVDPAFLAVAWARVRGNRGARTAGVDGMTAHYIEDVRGVGPFLTDLRADLKARRFTPLPVRERMIPKSSGKLRRWASRPSGTGSSKRPSNWSWNRSSRPTSSRVRTALGLGIGRRMPSLRSIS